MSAAAISGRYPAHFTATSALSTCFETPVPIISSWVEPLCKSMGVTPNLSRREPAGEPFAVTRVAELHIIAFDGGREPPDLCAMASTILSRYGLSVALGGLGKQVKQKRPLRSRLASVIRP